MNIKEELLASLKCCECNCYLSVSPIMIKEKGQNICGRCYVESEEEKLVHNNAYEALASHMLFPCRYRGKGCKELLPWNIAQYHEEGCEFQTYECPIYPSGSCEWEGLRSELLAHFENKHPGSILEHPCIFKPDIRRNSERNFLISAHGFLFLLQLKCSVTAAKLCYCVRFLGYENLASLFDFTVHMKTNLDELKKTKVVAAQKNITFEKDNFIEISINGLLINLGNYNEIFFSLTIDKMLDKFKIMECFYCGCFINSFEAKKDKNYCKKCSFSKSKTIKYKYLGCSYSDITIEKRLCMYDKSLDLKHNILNFKHFANHDFTFSMFLWKEILSWPKNNILLIFFFTCLINLFLDFLFSMDIRSYICPEPVQETSVFDNIFNSFYVMTNRIWHSWVVANV